VIPSVQGAFPACHLLLTHQACLHAVVVDGSIVRQIYAAAGAGLADMRAGQGAARRSCTSGETSGRGSTAATWSAPQTATPASGAALQTCTVQVPARPACMRMQTGARQRAPQHQDAHMLGCLQQGAVWLRRSPLQGPAKLLQVLLHGFSVYGGAGNVPGRLVAGPWRAPGRHRTRMRCSAAGVRVYMHVCAGQ